MDYLIDHVCVIFLPTLKYKEVVRIGSEAHPSKTLWVRNYLLGKSKSCIRHKRTKILDKPRIKCLVHEIE
jgi:hypothetical protein